MAKYLHGYTRKEQNRLIHQAQFLESWIYEQVDLRRVRKLLEVGCGVGAQTEILLRRWPRMHVTAVDLSPVQIALAEKRLAEEMAAARVEFHVKDAVRMELGGTAFDAAFLCWFLEHVPKPGNVLREVKRHLKPRGEIYCTEVLNSSLFVDPYSPAILQYWFAFNDYQWSIQGHPFVGAQLGNLLLGAGFDQIETIVRPLFFDSRDAATRGKFIKYFTNLLLSAAPGLLKAKRVTPRLVKDMTAEMRRLARVKDSVIYFTFVQAHAKA